MNLGGVTLLLILVYFSINVSLRVFVLVLSCWLIKMITSKNFSYPILKCRGLNDEIIDPLADKKFVVNKRHVPAGGRLLS